MIYSILLPLLALIMMLTAGFIGGFYAYAVETKSTDKHPYTANKKNQFYGKMLQYSLIAGSLYIMIKLVGDVLLAGMIYLYAEFFFPKVMGKKYKKIFAEKGMEATGSTSD